MEKVNLAEKFARIGDHWNPRIVAEVNEAQVKLVKAAGEFPWHTHAEEDELFYVVRGTIRLESRGGAIALAQGELCVVPRGVEHRPVADEEAEILLVERATTVNTGEVRHAYRRESLEKL